MEYEGIYVERKTAQEAAEILEEMGLDVNIAATMALKRIVRDGGISFMVVDRPKAEKRTENEEKPARMVEKPNPVNVERERITKRIALNLFRKKGYEFDDNVTFASKNKTGNYYWANISFEVLQNKWYLILNDWGKCELHLFEIKARKLKMQDLASRAGDAEKFELQIAYNDPMFTDTRSKVSFKQFCVAHITY